MLVMFNSVRHNLSSLWRKYRLITRLKIKKISDFFSHYKKLLLLNLSINRYEFIVTDTYISQEILKWNEYASEMVQHSWQLLKMQHSGYAGWMFQFSSLS